VGTMLYRRLHALTVVVGTFVHPAENIARWTSYADVIGGFTDAHIWTLVAIRILIG
jgi:hypothetical protein